MSSIIAIVLVNVTLRSNNWSMYRGRCWGQRAAAKVHGGWLRSDCGNGIKCMCVKFWWLLEGCEWEVIKPGQPAGSEAPKKRSSDGWRSGILDKLQWVCAKLGGCSCLMDPGRLLLHGRVFLRRQKQKVNQIRWFTVLTFENYFVHLMHLLVWTFCCLWSVSRHVCCAVKCLAAPCALCQIESLLGGFIKTCEWNFVDV